MISSTQICAGSLGSGLAVTVGVGVRVGVRVGVCVGGAVWVAVAVRSGVVVGAGVVLSRKFGHGVKTDGFFAARLRRTS